MLPFSRDVYDRLLEQYAVAIWPTQIAALALGIVVVFLILRPRRGGDRFIAAILAVGWIWIGTIFHISYLAPLNPGAWVSGALFVLQGGLLAWTGAVRERLTFHSAPTIRCRIGLGFVILAVFATPLAGPLTDLGWVRAPVAGIASGPTTLLTLGLLSLARGRIPLHLLLIPILWSMGAGVAAWLLRLPHDLILPLAAIVSLWLLIADRIARKAG